MTSIADFTTVTAIRFILLALYLLGTVGTGVELLLLEHTEDAWQWAPLGLMGVSLPVLGWSLALPGRASIGVFRGVTVLIVLSGAIGLWLHYHGNAEFELEMYPSLSGLGLFWEAVKGATPTLAPGTMIELGLLGLAYTYRHPALTTPGEATTNHNAGESR